MPRSESDSRLRRDMAVWVTVRVPAYVAGDPVPLDNGETGYEVIVAGEPLDLIESPTNRNDIDPMGREDSHRIFGKPVLEPAPDGDDRTPVRYLMDRYPVSRAELVRVTCFSPPKVDRIIASRELKLEDAAALSLALGVEVDRNVLVEKDREGMPERFVFSPEMAEQAALEEVED